MMNRRTLFLVIAPITLCCVAAVFLSAIGGTPTRTESYVVVGLLTPALVLGLFRAWDLSRELRKLKREDDPT